MRIAVASHTFSGDARLRQALSAHFPDACFNGAGRMLEGGELADFLADSPAAILGLERVDAALLDRCPRLAVISKFGVGLDSLDLALCAARGVTVLSTPGVNSLAVAELTLGLAIALARRIALGTHLLKRGLWVKNGGVQVFGKTVGLIGLGHVGKQTAAVFRGLGCPVLGHDVLDLRAYCAAHQLGFASLDEVLATSDVVSLHVPLTAATRGLIGAAELARMKPGAFLINTSRGGIVDEEALAEALERGHLAGAASDVFAEEPTRNARLLALESFIATPHVGGNSREAIAAVGTAAIDNLLRHFGRR